MGRGSGSAGSQSIPCIEKPKIGAITNAVKSKATAPIEKTVFAATPNIVADTPPINEAPIPTNANVAPPTAKPIPAPRTIDLNNSIPFLPSLAALTPERTAPASFPYPMALFVIYYTAIRLVCQ